MKKRIFALAIACLLLCGCLVGCDVGGGLVGELLANYEGELDPEALMGILGNFVVENDVQIEEETLGGFVVEDDAFDNDAYDETAWFESEWVEESWEVVTEEWTTEIEYETDVDWVDPAPLPDDVTIEDMTVVIGDEIIEIPDVLPEISSKLLYFSLDQMILYTADGKQHNVFEPGKVNSWNGDVELGEEVVKLYATGWAGFKDVSVLSIGYGIDGGVPTYGLVNMTEPEESAAQLIMFLGGTYATGFELGLDPNELPEGRHDVDVYVHLQDDVTGELTELLLVSFSVIKK